MKEAPYLLEKKKSQVSSENEVRVAIIGCGAITEEMYLPAAEMVPNLTITHVVDLDAQRGQAVAADFQIPNFVADYREVFGKVDFVVVATPPSSHAPISIDCLKHGIPVLCEKPLATSVEEAKTMITASQQTSTLLAVGMIRRLSWSSQLLRRLIQTGILGDIQRFDIEEGHEFNWPLRTGHIFQSRQAGGVLADTGPHMLDLLFWLLDSQRAELLSYSDDNWGGVGMNTVVELAVERRGKQIPGKIELSFTRKLRNTLRIYGEKGFLEAPVLNGYEVLFYPHNDNEEPIALKPYQANPRKIVEEFAVQLSNFVGAIINNSQNYVAAEEALTPLAIIGQCLSSRKLTAQPWEIKHLESFFEAKHNGR